MDGHFQKIHEICSHLELKTDQLLAIKDQMINEIKNCLRHETQEAATLKCWPTCVQDFPNGCEHGRFLVMDLGAFSVRISLFYLKGDLRPSITKELYEIPSELLASEAVQLIDYMAQCLLKFVNGVGVHRDPLPLVVTFCFPLQHESLIKAALTPYTNRFSFVHSKDIDLGKAVNDAIRSRNLRIQTVALLSDATGVLLASSWRDKSCKIGIVVGTGTSISYLEKTEEIKSYNKINSHATEIVNADWGDFGLNGLLNNARIDLDTQVDNNSSNCGTRLFEKMVSGPYAAELVRCLLVHCTNTGILFGGEMGKLLTVPFSLKTRHIVDILADDTITYETTRLMFDKLGIMRPEVAECAKVRYIAECVSRRSADLVAAGIACLMDKIGDKHIVVAIDGSFYRHNLVYRRFLEQRLPQLISEGRTFDLSYAEDGSDTGSAVLAATILQKDFIYQPPLDQDNIDAVFK